MTIEIRSAAETLDQAARLATPVAQLSQQEELETERAYAIQAASIALRVERGERVVGVKMGFTSRAKMIQMGISDVIFGYLTDAMQVEEGTAIDLARFIHPRAEPEIAFLLSDALEGAVTPAQALKAVAAVAPAIEIIDSRYQNFRFSLGDVIADNSSSSAFVIGQWTGPAADLSDLAMVFSVDEQRVEVSSEAILGDPLLSLAAASRLLAQYGGGLPAGSIVLAGGATAAIALNPGARVHLAVERLGTASFSVRGSSDEA